MIIVQSMQDYTKRVKIDYRIKKIRKCLVTFRQTVCLKMIQADLLSLGFGLRIGQ